MPPKQVKTNKQKPTRKAQERYIRRNTRKTYGKVRRRNKGNPGMVNAVVSRLADTLALPAVNNALRLPGPSLGTPPTSVLSYTATGDYLVAGTQRVVLINSASAPVFVSQVVRAPVYTFLYDNYTTAGGVSRNFGSYEPTGLQLIGISDQSPTDPDAAVPVVGRYKGKTYGYFPSMEDTQSVPSVSGTRKIWCTFWCITGGSPDPTTPIRGSLDVLTEWTNGEDVVLVEVTLDQLTSKSYSPGSWFSFSAEVTPPTGYQFGRLVSIHGDPNAEIRSTVSQSSWPVQAALYYNESNFLTGSGVGGWAHSLNDCLSPYKATTLIDYDSIPSVYDNVRLNASAILMTNVTKYLNKEGVSRCVRLPCSRGSNPFAVKNVAGFAAHFVKTISLKDGLYSYLNTGMVSSFSDAVLTLEYSDSFYLPPYMSGKTMAVPVIDLGELGYSNVIFLSDQDPTTPTTLAIQYNNHLEFLNSRQAFPVALCNLDQEDLRRAYRALEASGTFYENPTHIGAVIGLVSAAVRAAMPLLRPAVRAAAIAGGQSLVEGMSRLAIRQMDKMKN